MRVVPLAFVALASLLPNASIAAGKINRAAVMHERHEGMETIGKAFKTLHRELDAASPDMGKVRSSSATIANLSRKASGWFPAGTGPEAGKTGAKPEIWRNLPDFNARLAAFQRTAQGFNTMAHGHDVDGIRAAYADLGGACKGCHDHYRSEMKH